MTEKKELKDQRIPIMMSESELAELDDWAFKNRIRSRGEAVRRLCRTGLWVENDYEKFIDLGIQLRKVGNDDVLYLQTVEKAFKGEPFKVTFLARVRSKLGLS